MTDRVEIIARTERRRKYSDAEKAAILAQADQEGVSGSRPSMWCKIGCGHWAAFSGGLGCNL